MTKINSENLDILLVNVPQISLVYPPAATSLLKAQCERHGYSAKVLDLNLTLYLRCQDINTKLILDQYFSLNDHSAVLPAGVHHTLDQYIDECVNQILELNPRWVGISVFTFQCQIFTRLLLSALRPKYSGSIVAGGAGLSTNGISSSLADFAQYLKNQNLIDFFVRGEGDYRLISLLQGQIDLPGINSNQKDQINDLDALPYPNYEDVINMPYVWSTGEPQLPITGSRGCVRKCSFCDIHTAWKKYRYRDGKKVAAEMIYQYQKHGVTRFWFTDSLINGNMRTFRNLCQALVDFYQANDLPPAFFNWGGQFIVRDSRSMTKEDYHIAHLAGMNGVAVGVESMSEKVRDHMKKGFSNQDLDFMMEQIHAHDMNCYFLIMVGYPTETVEDFYDSINKFREYQKYALDGTIYGVNLGTTVSIDEGTPLYDDMNSDLRAHRDIKGFDWVYPGNPDLTFIERIRRRIEMQEILMDLGFKIWNADSQLIKLKEAYEKILHGNYKNKIIVQVAI